MVCLYSLIRPFRKSTATTVHDRPHPASTPVPDAGIHAADWYVRKELIGNLAVKECSSMRSSFVESAPARMNFLLLLPPFAIGAFSYTLLVMNTLFWTMFLFPVAALKLILPMHSWRDQCNSILNTIAVCWIACNNANLRLTKRIKWDVRGVEGLDPGGWYLVISNHQSWVDILVLQKVFHRRIPLLKFFLKKELIWVPVIGLAWWALEFPFMKRYSREYLEKNPHMQGRDLEITKKSCGRFSRMPTAVMNFVEGTRFTRAKHTAQGSSFTHLLKPKAGGVSFVLSSMGGCIRHILDVTIIYPRGAKSFWRFLSSREEEVCVRVEVLPVTPDLLGDYSTDPRYRGSFQEWLNGLWARKDRLIGNFPRTKGMAA